MRISTGYQFDSYSRGVSEAQQRMLEAQMRAQSGKRISKPSDDPAGAAAVVRMGTLKESLEQYEKNATAAKGILGATENALGGVADLAKRAYELAVRGANATSSPEARAAMAAEAAEMQRRLVSLGNSQDPSGGYLFAGQRTDQAPFAANMAYQGDAGVRQAEIGADQTLVVGTPGTPLLTDLYARLETLRTALVDNDPRQVGDVALPALQKSVDAVTLERGVIGTKLNTVADATSAHGRRMDELTSRISDTEELDLGQAIMDYRLAETAYEAALNVASQGFRLSLMDFIRG